MQHGFESAVEKILQQHKEYAGEIYLFVRDALDSTRAQLGKTDENPHLSARELYLGVCRYALDEFGPLAQNVLEFWGIRTPDDVGAVVYYLIEVGVFGRGPEDSREQFHELPPLQHVLDRPFYPSNASPDGEK